MTTSMQTVKDELDRFLSGNSPEVLCVSGEWGVGKTFMWTSALDDLRKSGGLTITRYSYVSLFGLNSLDDVKSSIFENMEWLDQPATNFSQSGTASAKAVIARAKKLTELAGALPWVGQALSRARPLYFSLIQSQIVCIDDLERRSKNLEVKDVLGLISFLREQRKCKVVLLLNAEKLGDHKADFDALLEKVIETKVVLAPTSAESCNIAIPSQDSVSVALRAHCETLGICNIRIIKRIESLARRIDALLTEFPQAIRDQAIHSITLFGWSKYDPDGAPPISVLRAGSLERYFARRRGQAPDPEEEKWNALLEKYKFRRCDDFDLALMNYVDSMSLDLDEVRGQASRLKEQQAEAALHGTFEAAWRSFHDGFDDNEDEVVRALVSGTKAAYRVVSLPNLNEAVLLLRRLGRNEAARELLTFFSETCDPAYWARTEDPFARGPYDAEINEIIESKKPREPEHFDVAAALIRAGKDYDRETIAKLAAVSADTYYQLISVAHGDQLRSLVLSALEFRRIANASEEMRRVVALMEEALRRVAATSPLNALRVKKYGID